MCRFLLAKSKTPISPKALLDSFSSMAQKSKAYDGDWQGDGWGISWLENNQWFTQKSLLPIWTEKNKFSHFPQTTLFVIHARSASFPAHKNNLGFNQPFVNHPNSFVFNGFLKGVSLSSSLPGDIGAQKIWSLLRQLLNRHPPLEALDKLKEIILKNTRQVQALNIGLADQKNIYVLNYSSKHKKYYRLHYFEDDRLKLICSEPLSGKFIFKTLANNSVVRL